MRKAEKKQKDRSNEERDKKRKRDWEERMKRKKIERD